MWKLKKTKQKQNKNKLLDTENRLIATREKGFVGRAEEVKGINCMGMGGNQNYSSDHFVLVMNIEL